MLDYEELILARQDLQEIYEDNHDCDMSCPYWDNRAMTCLRVGNCPSVRNDNKCWWDDLPDEVFEELTEDDLFYEDDLYNGVNLI